MTYSNWIKSPRLKCQKYSVRQHILYQLYKHFKYYLIDILTVFCSTNYNTCPLSILCSNQIELSILAHYIGHL